MHIRSTVAVPFRVGPGVLEAVRVPVGVLLFLTLAGALLACRSPAQLAFVRDAAEVSGDGLLQLESSPFQVAWLRPGASLEAYDKVWLLYTGIEYRSPPIFVRDVIPNREMDNFALSEGLTRRLEKAIAEIFLVELMQPGEWEPAEGVGPGVLVVRTSLVDLVVHAPLEALGADIYRWLDSAGEVTVVIQLFDSETGQILARVADRRALAPPLSSDRPMRASAGDVTYEARRVFHDWGWELRSFLYELKSGPPPAS